MTPKTNRLLREIAQQFNTLSAPMSPEWAAERNLTLDEIEGVASVVAAVLRWFADQPLAKQAPILAEGLLKLES